MNLLTPLKLIKKFFQCFLCFFIDIGVINHRLQISYIPLLQASHTRYGIQILDLLIFGSPVWNNTTIRKNIFLNNFCTFGIRPFIPTLPFVTDIVDIEFRWPVPIYEALFPKHIKPLKIMRFFNFLGIWVCLQSGNCFFQRLVSISLFPRIKFMIIPIIKISEKLKVEIGFFSKFKIKEIIFCNHISTRQFAIFLMSRVWPRASRINCFAKAQGY